MKRSSITKLGETEMEVLQHVWDTGEASVGEVRDRIAETRPLAYTTVMTVMKKLADKGYLTFRRDGTSYIYRAAKPPERVRSSLLGGFLSNVFRGSRTALVQTLIQDEPLSDEEREAIRALLDDSEGRSDAQTDTQKAASDD
jgi:predicted transcriptional regulator